MLPLTALELYHCLQLHGAELLRTRGCGYNTSPAAAKKSMYLSSCSNRSLTRLTAGHSVMNPSYAANQSWGTVSISRNSLLLPASDPPLAPSRFPSPNRCPGPPPALPVEVVPAGCCMGLALGTAPPAAEVLLLAGAGVLTPAAALIEPPLPSESFESPQRNPTASKPRGPARK